MSVKIITENLKSGNFASLYYIHGEEEYLKQYYYSELRNKTVTDLVDFNVIEFDSKNFDYTDFCNCVNSYPVMADRKFVGVTDLSNSLLTPDFQKKFVEFLKSIPDFCTVVFYDTEFKKVSGKNKLEDAVIKAGGVNAPVSKPTPSGLMSWCARHFKKAGKNISADDLNYMLSITYTDMRSLANEISKLCSFASEDTVTREHIDAVVVRSIDANRYEISDAFASSDYQKVFDIIDKMYKQNIDDILIVGTFYYSFVDLWKAKLALDCGRPSAEIVSALGVNQFALRNILRNVKKFDRRFLEECIEVSLDLDMRLKSIQCNKRDMIMGYVAELVSRRRKFA